MAFFSWRQRTLGEEFVKVESDILTEALDPFKFERLSVTFLYWQICSVVLGLSFLGFTDFSWREVIVFGDKRYLVQAIVYHSLWALTWIFISLPLFITWYCWHSIKTRAVSALVLEPSLANINREIALKTMDLHPIGTWNFTATGIIALLSLAAPLIKIMT